MLILEYITKNNNQKNIVIASTKTSISANSAGQNETC